MEALQRLYALSSTVRSNCPSCSSTLKGVASIAGAILCFRYAPKITAIVFVTGAAFYYGARYLIGSTTVGSGPGASSKSPTKKIQEPNEALDSPDQPATDPATIAERAASTAPKTNSIPLPSKEEELKPTSLTAVNTWIQEVQAASAPVKDLGPVLWGLWGLKPQGLDILGWHPSLTEEQIGNIDKHLWQDPDIKLETEKIQSDPSSFAKMDVDFQAKLEKKIADCIFNVIQPENDFMKTIFALCAVLGTHPSLLSGFLPHFKKMKDTTDEVFKNCEFRKFVIAIILLSRNKEGVAHIFSMIKPIEIIHPLEDVSPENFYPHFLAYQQWYSVTKDPSYVEKIRELLKAVQSHLETLGPSIINLFPAPNIEMLSKMQFLGLTEEAINRFLENLNTNPTV